MEVQNILKKYVIMVKVLKPDTKYQTKEIQYSGRRHIELEAAHKELEKALKDKTTISGWIVEEESR